MLLRPLPYHEPDRLVRLASTDQANNLTRVGFSYSRFLDVQQRQQVFSDLALSIGNAFTLTGRGDPEQLHWPARLGGAAAGARTAADSSAATSRRMKIAPAASAWC